MAREMKDSGIEWIGEIPKDWNLYRMKSCVSERTSGAWGNEAIQAEGDTICLRVADFDYSRFRFKDTPVEELTIRNYEKKTIADLLLRKGDILVEKSGGGEKTPVGRSVIFDKDYAALYANFMDRLRCTDSVTCEWMQFIFVTFYKNDYSKNYIKQTTGIQNLDLTSMLSNERMPVPSLFEQKRIINFLNIECAHIDEVTEQTRASIEEYKKLKQAVITQAVTKGIRPGRKMKDSGIEWIGMIPDDWSVSPIKRILSEQTEKTLTGEGEQLSVNQKKGVVKAEESDAANPSLSTIDWKIVHRNDIVFNKYKAHSGVFFVSEFDGIVTFNYSVFRCINGNYPKYFEYQFKTDGCIGEFIKQMRGVGESISPLYTRDLFKIFVAVPPVDIQQEIANYIDNKLKDIDGLIRKKELFISELEMLKKSLIYEYVTGKKEVPV